MSIKFKQSYIYNNKKACDMPGFFLINISTHNNAIHFFSLFLLITGIYFQHQSVIKRQP